MHAALLILPALLLGSSACQRATTADGQDPTTPEQAVPSTTDAPPAAMVLAARETIVVDPSGAGDARSISDALKAARAGDLVLVGPGRYREQVHMVSGVTVRSVAGPQQTAIFKPEEGGNYDLLWENNVFGPSAGEGHGNVVVESGHHNAGGLGPLDGNVWRNVPRDGRTPSYPSGRFVIRNNLFVDLKGESAFGFHGPDTALLYNNVFYRDTGHSAGIIAIKGNPGTAGGTARHCFSCNNVFAENGEQPIYQSRGAAAPATILTRANNLYYRSGPGGALDLADESPITDQDPRFIAAAIPRFDPAAGTAQIAAALRGFRLRDGSPAIGAGVDPFRLAGEQHPTAVAAMRYSDDAFGQPRPHGAAWDLGLHEHGAGAGAE